MSFTGIGDTYFSGKQLAKLGRIIVIASELKGLAATPSTAAFDLDDPSERELYKIVAACKAASLPSDAAFAGAVARLRRGVEVWLDGSAEAKFVYDTEWGGIVSCGCLFNEKTRHCDNRFPNCPSFSDPGLNFGNGEKYSAARLVLCSCSSFRTCLLWRILAAFYNGELSCLISWSFKCPVI